MGGKEWLRRLRSMNEGQTTAGSRGGVQKDRRVSGWERRGEEWWRRRRWKHHTMNAGTAGRRATSIARARLAVDCFLIDRSSALGPRGSRRPLVAQSHVAAQDWR
jgi:hypothetical protein